MLLTDHLDHIWCWIRRLENNCSRHDAGFIEQIAVATVPLGLIVLLTVGLFIASLFLLFIASLFLLGYAIIKTENLKKVRITKSVFFLIALMLALYVVEMISYFALNAYGRRPLWKLIAISIPLTETLTLLVLLVAIHLPLSSLITCVCCDGHGYTTHHDTDQATMRTSSVLQQPSYTTWNSPHSSNTDSQTLLLAGDKQPQNYM